MIRGRPKARGRIPPPPHENQTSIHIVPHLANSYPLGCVRSEVQLPRHFECEQNGIAMRYGHSPHTSFNNSVYPLQPDSVSDYYLLPPANQDHPHSSFPWRPNRVPPPPLPSACMRPITLQCKATKINRHLPRPPQEARWEYDNPNVHSSQPYRDERQRRLSRSNPKRSRNASGTAFQINPPVLSATSAPNTTEDVKVSMSSKVSILGPPPEVTGGAADECKNMTSSRNFALGGGSSEDGEVLDEKMSRASLATRQCCKQSEVSDHHHQLVSIGAIPPITAAAWQHDSRVESNCNDESSLQQQQVLGPASSSAPSPISQKMFTSADYGEKRQLTEESQSPSDSPTKESSFWDGKIFMRGGFRLPNGSPPPADSHESDVMVIKIKDTDLSSDSSLLHDFLHKVLPQYCRSLPLSAESVCAEVYLMSDRLNPSSLSSILNTLKRLSIYPIALQLASNPQLGDEGISLISQFILESPVALRWISLNKTGISSESLQNIFQSVLDRKDIYPRRIDNHHHFTTVPLWIDINGTELINCDIDREILSFLDLKGGSNLYCLSTQRLLCGINRCGQSGTFFHLPKLIVQATTTTTTTPLATSPLNSSTLPPPSSSEAERRLSLLSNMSTMHHLESKNFNVDDEEEEEAALSCVSSSSSRSRNVDTMTDHPTLIVEDEEILSSIDSEEESIDQISDDAEVTDRQTPPPQQQNSFAQSPSSIVASLKKQNDDLAIPNYYPTSHVSLLSPPSSSSSSYHLSNQILMSQIPQQQQRPAATTTPLNAMPMNAAYNNSGPSSVEVEDTRNANDVVVNAADDDHQTVHISRISSTLDDDDSFNNNQSFIDQSVVPLLLRTAYEKLLYNVYVAISKVAVERMIYPTQLLEDVTNLYLYRTNPPQIPPLWRTVETSKIADFLLSHSPIDMMSQQQQQQQQMMSKSIYENSSSHYSSSSSSSSSNEDSSSSRRSTHEEERPIKKRFARRTAAEEDNNNNNNDSSNSSHNNNNNNNNNKTMMSHYSPPPPNLAVDDAAPIIPSDSNHLLLLLLEEEQIDSESYAGNNFLRLPSHNDVSSADQFSPTPILSEVSRKRCRTGSTLSSNSPDVQFGYIEVSPGSDDDSIDVIENNTASSFPADQVHTSMTSAPLMQSTPSCQTTTSRTRLMSAEDGEIS